MSVCVSVPYRSTHNSSDCDETFTSLCPRWKFKKFTRWSTRSFTFPVGAHTVHPIAMKRSQVIDNLLVVVLKIKKKLKLY